MPMDRWGYYDEQEAQALDARNKRLVERLKAGLPDDTAERLELARQRAAGNEFYAQAQADSEIPLD
jgi:hypothetical protein